MGKKRSHHRRGRDGWNTLTVAPESVLVAWANLVSAMVATMQDAGLGRDTILGFLDHLDQTNIETLDLPTLKFALHVTLSLREQVPSND